MLEYKGYLESDSFVFFAIAELNRHADNIQPSHTVRVIIPIKRNYRVLKSIHSSEIRKEKFMFLRIGDKYKRIVDVMNNCFGWNYKACYKGWYPLNKYKKTSAWFPKIADLSYGKPVPGDKNYGWCNTMSKDGKYIYMNNFENPRLLNKEMPVQTEPHITFVKFPNTNYYQYAGVFARRYRDKELGWVCERIAEDINTADYL